MWRSEANSMRHSELRRLSPFWAILLRACPLQALLKEVRRRLPLPQTSLPRRPPEPESDCQQLRQPPPETESTWQIMERIHWQCTRRREEL